MYACLPEILFPYISFFLDFILAKYEKIQGPKFPLPLRRAELCNSPAAFYRQIFPSSSKNTTSLGESRNREMYVENLLHTKKISASTLVLPMNFFSCAQLIINFSSGGGGCAINVKEGCNDSE